MAVIIWDISLEWFKPKFKFPRYNFTPHISQTFSSQEYFSGNNSIAPVICQKRSQTDVKVLLTPWELKKVRTKLQSNIVTR